MTPAKDYQCRTCKAIAQDWDQPTPPACGTVGCPDIGQPMERLWTIGEGVTVQFHWNDKGGSK
jgi:hypothetical protein